MENLQEEYKKRGVTIYMMRETAEELNTIADSLDAMLEKICISETSLEAPLFVASETIRSIAKELR